ncbi:MAG: aldo/keto reductase [Paracoccaceae bacterium]|uniref:aldo/keto reductase n=1 Tax=Candidatus Salinivivens marinus TaxID=3381703 RepID=UPI000B6F60B6|nr:oxidoreductase [Marinovum sp.]OUU14836.1 MAG: oxidoreductase [Rhodobacteraceae bacterium TMED38]PDH61318.1 MAG: oxidoreductase [Rhodobacteraceae bacterium MED-G08]
MEKSRIKNSNIRISKLSFGTSALGDMPDTYGYSVDEGRARETINAIFESECNLIDTSRNYGFGNAEKRIGQVIQERGGLPDGFVISTKLDRDMKTQKFDATRARKSIEESLDALKVDSIGLLHLHDPEHCRDITEITSQHGSLTELFKMKEEGLAETVGLAMGKTDLMLEIIKDWPFDAIINHNRFTILNRNADELYNYAYTNNISIINAAPYASGVLAKGTERSRLIAYSEATDKELEPVKELEKICRKYNIPLPAAALQFSLNDKRISSTLVGVTKPKRVIDTIELSKFIIPNEAWDEINQLPYTTHDVEAAREYKPG